MYNIHQLVSLRSFIVVDIHQTLTTNFHKHVSLKEQLVYGYESSSDSEVSFSPSPNV